METQLVALWKQAERLHMTPRELKRQLRNREYDLIEMTERRVFIKPDDWRRFLLDIGMSQDDAEQFMVVA